MVTTTCCWCVLTPTRKNKPYGTPHTHAFGRWVRSRPYRLPEPKKKVVQEEVGKMLKMGVIDDWFYEDFWKMIKMWCLSYASGGRAAGSVGHCKYFLNIGFDQGLLTFLGLENYHHWFIADFSCCASLLTDLTQKGASGPIQLTEQGQEAFLKMKSGVVVLYWLALTSLNLSSCRPMPRIQKEWEQCCPRRWRGWSDRYSTAPQAQPSGESVRVPLKRNSLL